ncbi:hypothetical protein Taro_054641 [Colocasia esculenta]|uniref:Calcineurin-binding protein 1 n=1 Tax=Colocasia esculenta TaxID=4460 RepID=A0A843XRU2_COLES|nr:hypothetical protein [Colocasia esculenta]
MLPLSPSLRTSRPFTSRYFAVQALQAAVVRLSRRCCFCRHGAAAGIRGENRFWGVRVLGQGISDFVMLLGFLARRRLRRGAPVVPLVTPEQRPSTRCKMAQWTPDGLGWGALRVRSLGAQGNSTVRRSFCEFGVVFAWISVEELLDISSMFSITAINDTESRGKWEPLAPSKEAQEFHLSQTYHDGLLKLQAKDYVKACELLEAVLKDPLITDAQISGNASDGHLLQLRFLALKNLAAVFLQQGAKHYDSALQCYLQAVEIDSKDSVVWNQLGTLSCSMGLLSTSRWAFEQGLLCSPNNWNCMEKLLEILIAIGDEVSCLSVADLILRHWPSHSRALHVKKTIEDAEPIPFAPRGIDKLEPKHVRLKFPTKRKAEEDKLDNSSTLKRQNQNIDVYLAGMTWKALVDAILGILLVENAKNSGHETGCTESNMANEIAADRHVNLTSTARGIVDSEMRERNSRHADVKIIMHLSSRMDGKGVCVSVGGENMAVADYDFEKTRIVKEQENYAEEEHPQERRSTRLERLRSRKPEKEDIDSSSGKDLDKAMLQCLEHFIQKKSKTADEKFLGCCVHVPDIVAYSSLHEYNDVKRFIDATAKNCGAYHIGHLLLEEAAIRNITYHNNFMKLMDLEKKTRHWGQDRTPLCSLFLAELYYAHGLHVADEQKRSEFFSEASYHLCKVVELISLDFSPVTFLFSKVMDDSNGQILSSECMAKILPSGESNENVGALTEDFFCQQSKMQTSSSTYNNHFWVRFFWLSGCLSLSSGCKGKAIKEFSVCLSILENCKKINDSDAIVPLPHCKLARWLTIDRVHYQINLLKVDSLLRKAIKMMKKGKQKSSIDLLSPLLLSAKGIYPDFISGPFVEGFKSIELRALDILISACEKVEPNQPMEIETYLTSHRRKLQVLTWAAGLIDSVASVFSEPKLSITSDSDHTESSHRQWSDMIYEEVKEISRCASRVKNVIDQGGAYSDFNTLINIVGDVQSLLLIVMHSAVKTILGQKVWGMGIMSQTDQLGSWCLVDAAIAFCKFQHLDPTVPIKAQVELIVAIHDLLAEYGLCCAGKDSEGEEGTFLKLAIKHLLALDVKMKSSLCSSNKKLEAKQGNESFSIDGHERSVVSEPKSFFTQDAGVLDKDECAYLPNECMVEVAPECSDHERPDKGEEGLESRRVSTDIDSHSSGEKNGSCNLTDSENLFEDLEREKVELGLDNALDQSFFCLYGLNLKCGQDSLSDDELASHKNTNRGDYQTKEQCADVFQYILPYAKISSRAGMVKLRRVLRAIRKHFSQPPDDMLTQNPIHNFLENPDLSEDNLCEMAGSDKSLEAIMGALYPDGKSSELYKTFSGLGNSDPYVEVYSNLYYFIGQAEEISATDKFPGFVLKKEGEEFVEQNANLFKYDLLYNPLRFESWQKLANIYDEEVDLLLNDGSKHINAVDWRRNLCLPQRVEMGRRRSRRCLLMSLALAKTPAQRSQLHELLGLVYYDSLQNVVPFYDQRSVVPTKDAAWRSFCHNSMKHFEKAFSLKPEWLHVFYLGKICEKMGYSSDKAFFHYSKAISLNPSAVDPLYRLHASRIKLLSTHGKQNLVVLQTVASYSFNESTKNVILDMFGWKNPNCHHPVNNEVGHVCDDSLKAEKIIEPQQLDEAWHLLYNDCLSALEVCVEGELKHFHRARYRLAQGLHRRCETGDLEKAKEELAFCFRSSRSSFTINMWEIDSMVKKGRRKTPGTGGNRRCLEVSLPESSRKFITCIRKYILFYTDLLEKTKDLYTLERAYSYVRTDKRFSLCLGDIAPIILGRYIKVLVSSMHNAETIPPTDSTMSPEHLLERLFNILMDHVNQLADVSNLPEVKCPELSESSLYGYIHQYIHHLETDGRIDALEGINEKIRKRFKTPKLSNSNLSRIYKHASVAWCRSILTKLALITPLSGSRSPLAHISTSATTGSSDSGLLLFVDLEPDDISRSSLEGSFYVKGLEVKSHELLSRIKDVHVRQASDENMEAATTLLRCAYNFFRESSCGSFPSGISLYTVPSLSAAETISGPTKEGVDILDLSIPRKLLLWAYTLVHGRYSSISSVMKYFEENTKSRMRKAVTASSASAHPVLPTYIAQTTGGKERNEADECPIVEEISSVSHDSIMLHASETGISLTSCLQLHHCSTAKTIENTSIQNKGDNLAD